MIDKLTVERDAERDAWQERETQLQREIESFHMRARMLESNLNKVHLQVVEAEKVREHNIFLQRRWDEEQARGMLTHEEARDLYALALLLSAPRVGFGSHQWRRRVRRATTLPFARAVLSLR